MKKADWALALASSLVGLFAVEILLNQFANLNSRPVYQFGRTHYDGREWLHALYDLNVAGVEAYPIVSAEVFGEFFLKRNDETATIPLAGIARVTTTFCNELGNFIVYKSDRYGFRNDDRLWDSKPPVMLVGDSFAQGACVSDEATISANLTREGLPTLSVGYNSNGPLVELGTLVEYGSAIKPPVVVWLYHEGNDLTDLGRELEFPVLRKYLGPEFRQGLMQRQAEIDLAIKASLAARPEIQAVEAAAKDHWALSKLAQLRNTRALVLRVWRDTFATRGEASPPELDDTIGAAMPEQRFADLERVLARAKQVVADWNGRLLLAYLPASERYRFPEISAVTALAKDQAAVERIATRLDVPVIDIGATLSKRKDPAQLYPKANWPVHLTETGYAVVSAAIADGLRATPPPALR